MKKRGLGGRGLNALLDSSRVKAEADTAAEAESTESGMAVDGELKEVPIDLISRGQYQPRQDMDAEALEELAESIRQQGIIQPIVLRPISSNRYEIIAGERRWRAAQLAGLQTVPSLVREVPDEAAIAMALIENIQRENLNPVEEAIALKRLQDEFGLTQQKVAEAVGKSRSSVTNLLRLLTLESEVRVLLEHGDIEMGHARALLGLESGQQREAANQVVSRGLSVRQTETLVRKMQNETPVQNTRKDKDRNILRLEEDLTDRLGASVTIDHSQKGKGKLVIQYASLDELDGILNRIH